MTYTPSAPEKVSTQNSNTSLSITFNAQETGTAQTGAASNITLAAGANASDDYYNGMYIEITKYL